MSKLEELKKALPDHTVRVRKDMTLHGEDGTEAEVTTKDAVLTVFVANKTAVSDEHFARIVASYARRIE